MRISEVRVVPVEADDRKLQAFCSITIDDEFVIRDLRVIDTADGLMVVMPNRKRMGTCAKCTGKNHLRAKFCNQCGERLRAQLGDDSPDSTVRLHADIAHPINPDCRRMVEDAVLSAYRHQVLNGHGRNGSAIDLSRRRAE